MELRISILKIEKKRAQAEKNNEVTSLKSAVNGSRLNVNELDRAPVTGAMRGSLSIVCGPEAHHRTGH